MSRALADLVLLTHASFVLFVVLGGFLVWRWPRLVWLHAPAVVWGVVVEVAGWPCPLTPLENQLRLAAGEAGYTGGVVDHHLGPILYPEALTRAVQLALGAGVLAVNFFVYGHVLRARRTRAGSSED